MSAFTYVFNILTCVKCVCVRIDGAIDVLILFHVLVFPSKRIIVNHTDSHIYGHITQHRIRTAKIPASIDFRSLSVSRFNGHFNCPKCKYTQTHNHFSAANTLHSIWMILQSSVVALVSWAVISTSISLLLLHQHQHLHHSAQEFINSMGLFFAQTFNNLCTYKWKCVFHLK